MCASSSNCLHCHSNLDRGDLVNWAGVGRGAKVKCIRSGCRKVALAGSNYCSEHTPGGHSGKRKKAVKKAVKKAIRKVAKKSAYKRARKAKLK